MISCTFENGSHASLRHVVVHGIVEKDGALLLVKRAPRLLEGGKWSLPSGYMERDETAAECAVRELREETGWQCEFVSYLRVNTYPNRPGEDRQNVAIDCILKPIRKVSEGDDESTAIEWVPIDKLLPLSEYAFDHGESIKMYVEQKNNQHILPIIF